MYVQGQFPFAQCVISSCLLDQLLVLGVQGQFPFAQCVISSGLLDLVLVLGVRGQPR